MKTQTVLVGFIGAHLDACTRHEARWHQWRPSIALCQQEDLIVARFHMLYGRGEERLRDELIDDLAAVSPETRVEPHRIDVRDRWNFEEVFGALHDLARSFTFDTEREDWLVHITTGTHVEQICLFLLTESRYFPARLVQTSPPKNRGRVSDRRGQYQLIDLDLSRYDRLAGRFAEERQESSSLLKSGIATRNTEYNRLIDRMERVAAESKSPILLTGATGVGKTRIAGRIYELKRRRQSLNGPLVEVNCATLCGDMASSALFGHVKGAFTGAVTQRDGFLRAANGGVLFLDEIAELGPGEQATLLRALEEKRFRPVGSDRETQSDFQLLAGSNRDLPQCVRDGSFRKDLLARIDLWTFRLPSLAERPEDIAPNIDYELKRFALETGNVPRFQRRAFETFLNYAVSPEAQWPANFRDLHAAIYRMATLARGGLIAVEDVRDEIARLRQDAPQAANATDTTILTTLFDPDRLDTIDLFDRATLERVVQVCRNTSSLSEAGRVLYGASRKAKKSANDADRLRKYLARFELDWDRVRE